MKILEVLPKEAIITDMKSKVKKEVIEELVASISKITGINSAELIKVLLERERLGSTGIGGGIGIPHGKLKNLESLIMGFGLSRKGVDFESIDGRPTHLFFILLTPENSTGLHLKLLARISRLLKNESFKNKLMKATDSNQVYSIIEEVDEDF
ncbi:MAG: PTS sugar transporter subunit IIA [Proteobacteria bacterium]|nr:PTS sugar transporter subunit IIA [Pseudomonadota bacterium]MBU1712590.1 PTS sugar transporter subunit IIA [Pseudomonadota bacterium]